MWSYFIYTYGSQVLLAVLCMIFGGLALLLRTMADRYLTDACKRDTAATAAQFAEQVYKDLHGDEKLLKALESAEALLKKKGIPFDSQEMMILIEAAVGVFNDAFHKPLELADTADATRRVDGSTGSTNSFLENRFNRIE